MARKLTDEELGQRTRANNRRRSERQRLRMQESGKTALTVWIDAGIKEALNQTAIDRGATIADTATALLSAALATPAITVEPTPTPAIDPQPVETIPASSNVISNTERDREILALHRAGVSNPEIGRRFGTSESSIRRALKRLESGKAGKQHERP